MESKVFMLTSELKEAKAAKGWTINDQNEAFYNL